MKYAQKTRIETLKANGYMELLARSIAKSMSKEEIALWRKSLTFTDFYNQLRDNPTMNRSNTCILLFKNDWYWHRGFLGDKCKKTISDVGGLKIKSGDFEIIVPNGIGDGDTRYAVLEHSDCSKGFNFFTTIKGSFDIYSYDCGNDIIETVPYATYFVYYYEGMIIFAKED